MKLLLYGWFIGLFLVTLAMFLARRRDGVDEEAGVKVDNTLDPHSNCCGRYMPRHPESDLCPECREHCEAEML